MTRSQRPSQDHILGDSLKKPKNQAHTPRDEHISRDSPKKAKIPKLMGHEVSIFLETVPKKTKDSGTSPTSEMSIFFETIPKNLKYQNSWATKTVSRNMLTSWPMSFGIFVFFGTVSRNMLVEHLVLT